MPAKFHESLNTKVPPMFSRAINNWNAAGLVLVFVLLASVCTPRETPSPSPAPREPNSTRAALEALLGNRAALADLSFAEVVSGISGHEVLPFDPDDPVDREIRHAVEQAGGAV
ncbi:MAG: hypothetical protein ACC661_12215, partial [Verrucomicrobiales bacterium]